MGNAGNMVKWKVVSWSRLKIIFKLLIEKFYKFVIIYLIGAVFNL